MQATGYIIVSPSGRIVGGFPIGDNPRDYTRLGNENTSDQYLLDLIDVGYVVKAVEFEV